MSEHGIEPQPEKYMSQEKLEAFTRHLTEPQYWFRCVNGHAFSTGEPDMVPNCLICNELAAPDVEMTKWHASQRARRAEGRDSL